MLCSLNYLFLKIEISCTISTRCNPTQMKVGLDLDTDEQHVRAVRSAIGPGMSLMVDANHAYSLKEAAELCRRIQDCNIAFFEEPVSPEFYGQYSELRSKTSIPVAGGECEYLAHGFKATFIFVHTCFLSKRQKSTFSLTLSRTWTPMPPGVTNTQED